jgi:LuxR family maltose regulon positive regulatory protein
VSCWLNVNNVPFAWISLDENDNDIHTFMEYLTASIENLFPGKLANTVNLLSTIETPPIHEITNTLINELDEIDKEFILVLDDYYYIRQPEIHKLISGLLQYPPDNMHLCIITRQDPPLKIGFLRAYNRMNEIRMRELSFNSEEVPVLYKNMLGFEVDEEISERLVEITEGWVAGLRLTALSVNSPEQLTKLIIKMNGDSRLVTEYLIEEVLSTLPEELQRFLYNTSVLNRFCADLLDEIGEAGNKKMKSALRGNDFIKWLENMNLFLVPLDVEHEWFRFHHLFRELLLKQLKKNRKAEQLIELHRKAGIWYERNDFVEDALRHMLAADKPERAAEIIEKHITAAMDADKWRMMESWINMLPEDILKKRYKLQIAIASINKQRFKLEELHSALQRSKELLDKTSDNKTYMGEWYFLKGWVNLYLEGDISGSMNHLNKALKLIPETSLGLIRGEAELQYAMTLHASGKNSESIRRLQEKISSQKIKSGKYWERLQFGLCAVRLMNGDLFNVYNDASLLNDSANRSKIQFVEGWSRFFLAVSALHRFKLEDALHHFSRIIELRYITYDRASIDSILGLAIVYQMKGMDEEANKTILIANEYAEWTKNPSHSVLISSAIARLELLRGNIAEAMKWHRTAEIGLHIPSMVFFLCNPAITECSVLLAEGSGSSLNLASEKLDLIYQGTKHYNYKSQLIEVLILQSVLLYKQGHIVKAARTMEDALELAVPGGWIRPFIEFGNEVMIILDQLIKHNAYTEYCMMLKELFGKYEKGLKTNVSSHPAPKVTLSEPLTQRELEILPLLSMGYKNKEIGNKIFLAPTTVKKHVYNIFQKFNVHSRIELISKAKELDLI